MAKLIDEIHYYSRVVKMLMLSDDPEAAGALEYYLTQLLARRKQMKEVMA